MGLGGGDEQSSRQSCAPANVLMGLHEGREGDEQGCFHNWHFSGKWQRDCEPRSREHNGEALSDVAYLEGKTNRTT